MADPEVRINVRTTEAGGQSALGKVRSDLGALLTSIPGVGTALGAVASAAGVVGVAMATASKALREFAEAEKGIAGLDAALANFGHLTEENRERLQGLAAELQATTAIADDEWVAVLTKLVQFGAKPESIGMDVEAVKNLAGVVGDLGTAAGLYSKALQGNFEALSRYGIKVKDLDELQRIAAERGGGQLEARARTLGGLFDRLGNATSDFFESLGQGIAKSGLAQAVLGSLADIMGGLAERLGGAYASFQTFNRETAGAAEALAAYKTQAQQVLDLTARQVDALKAESKLLSEKQRILDQLTDSQSAMDLARVDLQVATGQMTEPEAIKARAGIRFGAAKEKIQREQATATSQLQLERDAVAAMEERKAVVDRDLARERARLVPEERLARIRTLIQSAGQSRQDYASAGKFALGEFIGDPEGAQSWADTVNRDVAGMRDWEQRSLGRVANQANLRRGRVSALEEMSRSLGDQIAAGRENLAGMQPRVQATVAAGNMDVATARMQQLAATAQAGGGQLDGAAKSVVAAMSETSAYARTVAAQADALRREIATLRAQVKDHANR
jgi:ABC-type transporter Mla subunit MlaD